MRLEWDPAKARSNQGKHHVSFDDAMLVFEDPYALFEQDRTGPAGELRCRRSAWLEGFLLLLVVHTAREARRDEVIRLISAARHPEGAKPL